jgi:dihydroorotate dehydrogenase (fumarate)
MGLQLENPVVASASPLSGTFDGIRRLEDAGVSAVVMPSLFEEEVLHEDQTFDYFLSQGSDQFAEALSYFPSPVQGSSAADRHLDIIKRASRACEIPIIASINGVSKSSWIDYAGYMVEAGAKGIELNIYFLPVDIDMDGATVENNYLDIVRMVKGAVNVPVAVKLSPYFSAFANMARRLDDAGANALVLFNRFYQPDFDIESKSLSSTLELSTPSEIRLPLLWTAVLSGHLKASIAAGTGVQTATEAIKYLLAGADVVTMASALLKEGPQSATAVIEGIRTWLSDQGHDSIEDIKGSMNHRSIANPAAFERANYVRLLKSGSYTN